MTVSNHEGTEATNHHMARHRKGPLAGIRRPRLLIRAARLGMMDYSRSRDLKRILRVPELPLPSKAVRALLETEAAMEENRKSGGTTYSVMHHVEVMIALMAEARLVPDLKIEG